MTRRSMIGLALAAAAGAAAVLLAGRSGPGARAEAQSQPTSRAGAAAPRTEVRALARLEPQGGVITVGARPGARVERVAVEEGQDVRQGDLIAVLEGHDARRRQLALAEAQKAAALFKRALRRDELALEREAFDRTKDTRLDNLRAIVRELRAKVGTDGTGGKEKDKDKDSAKSENTPATPPAGFGGGMVPPEVREAARAQMRGELMRAEVQLKELETKLDLLPRTRALEDRQAADGSPEDTVLDRQIDLARTDLADTEVRAPVAGRILSVAARAGEVSSGPVVSLGDVSVMTARAEVFQSDAPEVAPGDPAEVTILGRPVPGRVTRVGTLVGRNTIQSLDPTALTDRRVVEAVIRLDDPSPAARLVNMQVEAAIRKAARPAP